VGLEHPDWSDDLATNTFLGGSLSDSASCVIGKCKECDPASAVVALRSHGLGYLSMGFLNKEAITDGGVIYEDRVRSRRDGTEYYVVQNNSIVSDCATLRKDKLQPGGSIADFDCPELCRAALLHGYKRSLTGLSGGIQDIVESSALPQMPDPSSVTVMHLLRTAVQAGVRRNESSFFCAEYRQVGQTHGT